MFGQDHRLKGEDVKTWTSSKALATERLKDPSEAPRFLLEQLNTHERVSR